MLALGVRRAKAAPFQWVRIPPGQVLQPEATGAVRMVMNWRKPSVKSATNWSIRASNNPALVTSLRESGAMLGPAARPPVGIA